MNKLITNQTPYYTLSQESMLSFPNQELIEELKLQQTDQMQNQLITKVAAKASLMHKSQLTKTITDEVIETHKIIRIEPHQKYLIVDIENTTNDKVFSVKVDIPASLVQNEEGGGPLIVKYNITNTDPGYPLYFYSDGQGQIPFEVSGVDMFSKVEIDDIEIPISDLDNTQGKFRFDSGGDHTVKYTLKDPTFIGIEVDFSNYEVLKLGASFMGCTYITEVIIPNSIITIGENAFAECSGLTSVTIGNSVTAIGDYAFYQCSNLTSLTIGNSVESIGDDAFMNCTSLISVTISDSVTSIGDRAFLQCHSLTSLTLGNSITNIGSRAFENCRYLSSITIPSSITSIGNSAFLNCVALSFITIEAITPPTLGDSFNNTFGNTYNCPIYVPAESVQAYKTAWPEYADRILENYEYVDLGLPSHTLWATKNIGATNITDYGNYYMYGMGNKTYDNTDTPYAGTENPLTLSKDTAKQTWRGQWHMPQSEQVEELITNTTYQWVTNYNDSNVNGGLFTAQNGNSIFFPAAGEYWANGTQHSIGNTGSYWSSSPDSDSINYAYYLSFYDNTAKLNSISRNCGFSIRPVIGYPQQK